jgi:hypothetical protein
LREEVDVRHRIRAAILAEESTDLSAPQESLFTAILRLIGLPQARITFACGIAAAVTILWVGLGTVAELDDAAELEGLLFAAALQSSPNE